VSRSVVCISHAWGAGGGEIGRLVADRLGFLYVDEELISNAAARGGLDLETVADAERRKSMFAGLLDFLAEGGGAAFAIAGAPPGADEPPSDAVRAFIRDAIHEVASRGNVVIVAHAASYAVGAGPEVLRVFVTAPRETRSKRFGAADGLSDEEAGRAIKQSDAARVDYLKRFYGVGQELPIHYDLVINTDTLSAEKASALIVQAATDRPQE
jgi:cytidylate kinase